MSSQNGWILFWPKLLGKNFKIDVPRIKPRTSCLVTRYKAYFIPKQYTLI